MRASLSTICRVYLPLSLLITLIFLVLLAPFSSHQKNSIEERLNPPSRSHWLGTDTHGQDLYTSLLHGGRVTLFLSTITVLFSTAFGAIIGMSSGYYGAWRDRLIMRTIDIISSYPGILLALMIAGLFGPTYLSLFVALSLTAWVGPAKVARSAVLSLKNADFIQGAKALGANDQRILLRHLFPHIFPFLLIQMCLSFSNVILVESTLSFLGLGPSSNYPTWGQLVSQGKTVLHLAPHVALIPGSIIFLFVLTLNLLGDFLRDLYDPKEKKKSR